MRALRRILIVLVVLGVLLVVADRVGAWIAQRVVADQVENELRDNQVASEPPEVTIDRAPFLTQVAAGEYESVTLRLRGVGTGEFQLPQVELTATGVTASMGTLIQREGSIVASRVDGTATVGYASVVALTELEGLELGPADGGLLQVRLPTELLGQPVVLVGTAGLAVADGAVQLDVGELEVEEPPLPPGAESRVEVLIQQMSVTIQLPELPYGLTIDDVVAEQAGLVVQVSAVDVALAR
jgi:LmeA-like phospholipid-binding